MVEVSSDQRSEQFAERLLAAFNDSAMMLLISVGHRTGLFDVMSTIDAAGSQDIADRAGLTERYVREWLGGMVVSGVVEYDPGDETYRLPAEHAAVADESGGSIEHGRHGRLSARDGIGRG
jgi:hypothetical protein